MCVYTHVCARQTKLKTRRMYIHTGMRTLAGLKTDVPETCVYARPLGGIGGGGESEGFAEVPYLREVLYIRYGAV